MGTVTWTGGSTVNSNWGRGPNWSPAAAPVAGDDIVFAGTTRLTNYNDCPADRSFNSITYSSTAGAFVHTGNRITLAGSIVNDSTNLQTIGFDILTTAVRTVNCASGAIKISGAVNGTNGGIDKTGSGDLTLAGNSDFTGALTAQAGTLIIDTNKTATGTGTLTLYNGVTVRQINFEGNYSSGQWTSSNVVLNSGTINSEIDFPDDKDIWWGQVVSGAGGLRVYGSNPTAGVRALILAGNNTFQGGVILEDTRSLNLLHINALGTGTLTCKQSTIGLLSHGVQILADLSAGIPNNVVIDSGCYFNIRTNIGGTYPVKFTGTVSSSGSIYKFDPGTCTFSGTNTYTGGTYVAEGTLAADSTQAFGIGSAVTMSDIADTYLDITGYNITIGSLTGGGSTGGNIVLGSATLTIGSNDTSPAAYAANITGAGNIIKTGTGVLGLSAVNEFTGTVVVNGGELSAAGPNTQFGAIGHCSNCTINNGGTVRAGDSANSAFGWAIDLTPLAITINAGGTMTTTADPSSGGHLRPVVLNGGTVSAQTSNSDYGSWNFDYGISTPGTSSTTSYISGAGNMPLGQYGTEDINVGTGDTLIISMAINHVNQGDYEHGLVKLGTGTLILSGTNDFTSAIDVNAGTLLNNGASSGTGAITVANTATLGGSGSLAGAISVSSGGKIAPGAATGISVGILGTANVTFNSTSTYSVDLNGITPTFDKINSSGTVALGAAANTLTVASIAYSVKDKVYTIVEATSVTGTFSGKAEASTFVISGRTLRINYTATTVILTDVSAIMDIFGYTDSATYDIFWTTSG